MNTTALNTSRLTALALSAVLTLAMLAGVNGLAVHEAGIAVMAQSSASQV